MMAVIMNVIMMMIHLLGLAFLALLLHNMPYRRVRNKDY